MFFKILIEHYNETVLIHSWSSWQSLFTDYKGTQGIQTVFFKLSFTFWLRTPKTFYNVYM